MTALGDALRAAGLSVTEYGDAGRPYAWTANGVLLHHTAGAATGDAPSLGYIRSGNADVPGPLSQFLIARSGHVHLISEGRANHAGAGSGLVSAGIPTDQGNQYLWGIEVESTGQAPDWPAAQWDATHTVARVLLGRMGQSSARAWRHLDYAVGRKVDTRYELGQHRGAIDGATVPPPATPAPAPTPPPSGFVPVYRQGKKVYSSKMVYRQANSDSVWNLQSALLARGYSIPDGPTDFYGDQTVAATAQCQRDQGFTGADADGIAGKTTIGYLGLVWVNG